jgi:hypothetical protein
MDKQSLVLTDLSIRKLPGLPQGLPFFRRLNPQINLIYGINGSGKSSSARSINAILWRTGLDGLEAEASWTVGADRWSVRVIGGKALLQRNGVEAFLEGLPAAEGADRYMLALHQLVAGDDRELAAEIRRLSIGGYDMEAAGRSLSYSLSAERRSAEPYRAWERADETYQKVFADQEKVKTEERELANLGAEKAEGEAARDKLGWYEKLAAWLDAKRKADAADQAFATYPAILSNLTGNEYSEIGELEGEINKAEHAIDAAENDISNQGKLLTELSLPSAGLLPTVLVEVERQVLLLEEQEREVRIKADAVNSARAKEQEALAQLGAGKDPSSWSGLKAEDLVLVDEHLRRHHITLSEHQALDELVGALQRELAHQTTPPVDQLNTGLVALSRWLQTSGEPGIAHWLPWMLSAVGVGTAVAVMFVGAWGLLGIGLLLVAFIVGIRSRTDGRPIVETEYARLGLEMPMAWDQTNVMILMERLFKQLKESVWQDEVQVKLGLYQRELERLEPRMEKIKTARERLEEKLGLLPGAPASEELRTFDSLYWFLKLVSEWAAAKRERLGAEGELNSRNSAVADILRGANQLIEPYGLGTAVDGPSARAQLERLRSLDKDWHGAQTAIWEARAKWDLKMEQKGELQIRLGEIYSRLNLEDKDKELVRALIGQMEDYGRAKQESERTTGALSSRRTELEEHPFFHEKQLELEELQLDQVWDLIRENTVKVARLAQVTKKMDEINGRIQLLRQSNSLEGALTEKMMAVDALMERYESNLSAITGQLILNGLKQTLGDENQPAVYRRAKEIFNRVTNGRYVLIPPQAGETSGFSAYDTVQGWGQLLDVLSTATRIQLLLSVRLAFIEEQERGLRLPLLVDELLATTDEHRAEAVIEALAEFCREGRQVFYFTAQKEELIKWQKYLEDKADLSFALWELDGQTNEVNRFIPDGSAIPVLKLRTDIAEPAGRSHEEYGRLLLISGFDLINSESAALPLWYLIEDPEMLYRLYRQRIQYWGQLAKLLVHGGQPTGWTPAMTAAVRARAELLEHYQKLYRQGRSRRIGREVLADSDAISERFMEPVAELLANISGDPRELLRALRAKEVTGFRASSIEDLEKFLLDEGYIDDLTPLSDEDLLIRLEAFRSNSLITPEEVEKFLSRLTQWTAPGSADGQEDQIG